jgi:hypothetical protein
LELSETKQNTNGNVIMLIPANIIDINNKPPLSYRNPAIKGPNIVPIEKDKL